MTRPANLESLPIELLQAVCAALSLHDVPQVAQASKLLNSVATPLLWTTIELHVPDFHEGALFPDEFEIETSRKQYQPRNYFQNCWSSEQTGRFLILFEPDLRNKDDDGFIAAEGTSGLTPIPSARLDQLASLVRSLCLDLKSPTYWDSDGVEPEQEPWSLFGRFVNLEHLEINGVYDRWDRRLEAYRSKLQADSVPPLTKLRTLRLTGYLPAEFVEWACRGSVAQITDLTLALLDRPIGSANYSDGEERENPPQEYAAREDTSDADWLSEAEDFEEAEVVAPRALSALLHSGLIPQFASLARLTLRRPTESTNGGSSFQDNYVSQRPQINILREWRDLIQQARATLEILIMDQRPFAEEIEMDGTGCEEFMVRYSQGPGFEYFMDNLLPDLVADGAEWPKLKFIKAYGFDVPPDMCGEGNRYSYIEPVDPETTLLHALEQRFKPLGVDVTSGLGKRMLFRDESGEVFGGEDFDGFGGTMSYPGG